MQTIIDVCKKIMVLIVNIPAICKLLITAKKQQKIFLLFVPQYINYGDIAIQIAEDEFFRQQLQARITIDISIHFYIYFKNFIKKFIHSDDCLVLTGGGWMGDLWPFISDEAEDIIKAFPQNKIIFFPQTFFYKNEIACSQTEGFFLKHKNIFICARDESSYNLVKQKFLQEPNNAYYLPDTVLLLNRQRKYNQSDRKGILFCFRDDIEKSIDNKLIGKLESYLTSYSNNTTIKKIATAYYQFPLILPTCICKLLAEKKIEQIGKAKLLVTDRLHGMIFAAITGTPCLAFDNLSKKVSGVYFWIKHLDYIRVVTPGDYSTIINELNYLLSIEKTRHDNIFTAEMIKQMKALLIQER